MVFLFIDFFIYYRQENSNLQKHLIADKFKNHIAKLVGKTQFLVIEIDYFISKVLGPLSG